MAAFYVNYMRCILYVEIYVYNYHIYVKIIKLYVNYRSILRCSRRLKL